MMQRNEKSMGTDERPEPNAESGSSASPARGDIVDTFWDIPPISFDENDGGITQGDNGTGTVAGGVQSVFPSFDEVLECLLRVRRILLAMPLPLPMLWLLPR